MLFKRNGDGDFVEIPLPISKDVYVYLFDRSLGRIIRIKFTCSEASPWTRDTFVFTPEDNGGLFGKIIAHDTSADGLATELNKRIHSEGYRYLELRERYLILGASDCAMTEHAALIDLMRFCERSWEVNVSVSDDMHALYCFRIIAALFIDGVLLCEYMPGVASCTCAAKDVLDTIIPNCPHVIEYDYCKYLDDNYQTRCAIERHYLDAGYHDVDVKVRRLE